MRFSQIFKRMGLSRGWSRELWLTAIALVIGLAGMPALIFYTGASLLGRYEGASPLRIYESVYGGLKTGSAASWIVILGPYGLYLTLRALKGWWRLGAKPA
ncbi:MAG: hypothetical protein ACLQT5_07045 [Steroidobacteraceae bacterium]|jgi:hypothetical protein